MNQPARKSQSELLELMSKDLVRIPSMVLPHKEAYRDPKIDPPGGERRQEEPQLKVSGQCLGGTKFLTK